jgi:rare lipoprotein A
MSPSIRGRALAGALAKAAWSVPAAVAALLVCSVAPVDAKTPGKTYCFNRTCHRVLSIPEMVAIVGQDTVLQASYYDDCRRDRYNPCGLTSSGEAFRPNEADSAASPIYPDGTILLIRNPDNGSAAVVRVNNAGPYWRQRKLDVSRATAHKLGFADSGVAKLEVRVMSAPSIVDATYKRNRRYAPVPGSIGSFASLDQAQGGMMVAMALDAMSTSVFAPVAGKMLTAVKTMTPALANVLRSDQTRVASVDGTVPTSIAANFEKSAIAVEKPAAKVQTLQARQTPRRQARIVLRSSVKRSPVRAARVAVLRSKSRWAYAAAPRYQFKGNRSASSRSSRSVRFATGASSTKRSYWTSRASRNAAAMSKRGPRAMRAATRKLSSIVRSDDLRIAAASGAINPRLRT